MSTKPNVSLIVKNLEQVVQVCSHGELFKRGEEQDCVSLLERKSDFIGTFIAVDSIGTIAAVGHDDDEWLAQLLLSDSDTLIVDGEGCSVIPGFVDAHTHSVWSGDRLFEFDLKMSKPARPIPGSQAQAGPTSASGKSYLDIHKSGGGIYFTVKCTTESTDAELESLLWGRVNKFLSCGTTTLEIKTGYGLDAETELKQLRVIERVKRCCTDTMDIVTTLLPAHAVPKGIDAEQGTNHVIKMLDEISQRLDAENIQIDFIDAFCEKGVFEVENCRKIFEHAQKLFPKSLIGFHGEELSNLDSPIMAASLGARHVSHLEHVSSRGLQAMAISGVAAVLLPTTAYLLRLTPPPVREMIDTYGIIVALGSDFNPNAYCYSMAQVMLHGVIYYRMTLNESLIAATINSAYAIDKSKSVGSLETGKLADFIILKTKNWKNIIYQMGESKDLIQAVIKNGKLVKGEFP